MLSQGSAVIKLGTHGTNYQCLFLCLEFFFMARVVTEITCKRVQLDGISYFFSISGVS